MIIFEESKSSGYAARTIENASADATIAFASDFSTRGEILTRNSVLKQGKVYSAVIPCVPKENYYDKKDWVLKVNTGRLKEICWVFNKSKIESINIAGNGLYTLVQKGYSFTQDDIDEYVYQFLSQLLTLPDFKNKITFLRSGGQTGFDEAGIKAAVRLKVPKILVLAPKSWKFRGVDGKDVSDEKLFKSRFV